MSSEEFAAAMAEREEEWATARDEEKTYEPLPDGIHRAKVTSARVKRTDWGEWQWSIRFAGLDRDGSVWANRNLDNEVGLKIAARDAARLGYDGTLAGLPAAGDSGAFDGLVCDVKIQTKRGRERDFTEVYLLAVHGREEVAQGEWPGAATQPPDDDIPF